MHIKMAKLGLVSSRISQMAGHAGQPGSRAAEQHINEPRNKDSGIRIRVHFVSRVLLSILLFARKTFYAVDVG